MIDVDNHGHVRTLRLARPPVNALNVPLMEELARQVTAAPEEGVRGLVLTGAGGRFSAGLDVQVLLGLDADGLRHFLKTFFACLTQLARSPIPIAAAINGHSPAGGAVLALYCDRRVMAEGEYRIGLNEVQVGLFPGATIHKVLQRVVGARVAADLLPAGQLIDAAEALRVGFVDELAPHADVEARARAWLERMLALPPQAYAATRAEVRRDLVELMHDGRAAELERSVAAWSSSETRDTLRALLTRLARK
jgi:Delta3-Delta2-enoyl-CoA isomerase